MAAAGLPIDYGRIIKLFSNKHTEGLYDRQVSSVMRICRKNADGFFIANLPELEQIMQFVADQVIAGNELFIEPLGAMIVISGKEFRCQASHEEYRSLDAVVSYVAKLAEMLNLPDVPLQVTAAESIRQISRGYLADGTKRRDDSKWRYAQEVLCKARTADAIVRQLAAEVAELAQYDADRNHVLDDEEMHRARVANDADRSNDSEEYDKEKHAPGTEAGDALPPYFLGLLVKIVWEQSAHGENSRALVALGAPQLLVSLLSTVQNFRQDVISLSVECLWNMLEHSAAYLQHGEICLTRRQLLTKHREHNASFLLSTMEAAICLTSLFERLLVRGYKKSDKELRNEVVVVTSLVARRPQSAKLLVSAGFLSLLLEYSTAAEMELPVDANPRNFATSDPVDLEFKQLQWSLIAALCSTAPEAAIPRVQESLFVQTLLLYLDPAASRNNQYLQIWAPTQRRTLDLLAGRVLGQLAEGCLEQLQRHDAAVVALAHIRAHCSALAPVIDDETSTVMGGDEFGDEEGMMMGEEAEDDVDRQYTALRLLQSIVVPGDFQSQLGEAGAVVELLTLLGGIDAAVPPPAEVAATATVTAATANPSAVSAGLLAEAVFGVLAALCADGHEDNQTLFRRAGGINVLLGWLRYDPDDAVSKPMAVVSVVAALWEAIAGNRRSEAKFIVEDGVHVLLDLLDACPAVMRGQVLGCLADVCHNERALPYIRAWRSDTSGRDAITVALALWAEEEQRLGVTSDVRGEVSDLSRPLGPLAPAPAAAAAAGSAPSSAPGSPAAGSPRDGPPAFDRLRRALKASKLWTEVGGKDPEAKIKEAVAQVDLRSKIFSLLRSIGADFLAEGSDEEYKNLTWQNKLVFCVASRYFNFREGQLWQDLSDEFAKQRVNLIKADLLMVEKELDVAFREASSVKYKQHETVVHMESKLQEDDERFLDGIMAQKAGEEAAYVLAQQQHPLVRAKQRAKARRSKQAQAAARA